MKFFMLVTLTMFLTLVNPMKASAKTTEDQVRIEVIPSAVSAQEYYRSPENVRISLNGMFPNSCYKPVATQVSQVGEKILLTDAAMVEEGSLCYMALQPYQKSVDLGNLAPGSYQLYVNDGGRFRQAAQINVQ